MTEKFYITTAIDYPNAKPHVGHSFEKVAADVVARYHRLLGDDVQFCMGLDENSQHVVTAALKAGVSARQWIDDLDEQFRLAWRKLDISNDIWLRTSIPEHARASQELFRRALANGSIYKGTYEGWYCPNCNNYYTDEELKNGKCPEHGITPEYLQEENYFFALSKFSEQLLALFEDSDDFVVPTSWRAETLALIRRGLRDFSVSRVVRGDTWGIPIPDDPDHVIYVWFDALTNYATGVGFPSDPARFARYWPADVHVIGKNITRFHCLYWPAMLLAAEVPVPRQIAVHGFMTLEGQKISKTTGNLIDPVDLVDEFGSDAVRFYILREFSFAQDGDFSRAKLIARHNADLANDLGNLLNRTAAMSNQYLGGSVPGPGGEEPGDLDLERIADAIGPEVASALKVFDFPAALDGIWLLVSRANTYVEENAPWRLAKDPARRERLEMVLGNLAESLRVLSIWLAPFIPGTADRIREWLGLPPVAVGDLERAAWGSLQGGLKLTRGAVLFPRMEIK